MDTCFVLFLLDRYLGVELLCHVVTLCLTFWRTTNCFPKWLPHFKFPLVIMKGWFDKVCSECIHLCSLEVIYQLFSCSVLCFPLNVFTPKQNRKACFNHLHPCHWHPKYLLQTRWLAHNCWRLDSPRVPEHSSSMLIDPTFKAPSPTESITTWTEGLSWMKGHMQSNWLKRCRWIKAHSDDLSFWF